MGKGNNDIIIIGGVASICKDIATFAKISHMSNFTKGVTSSLIALISPTRKAARSVNHLMEQLMRSIQSILLSNCKESSKLVVLTNNYSPDYAPFTVDKKGTLEKVPVQIRVGFEILKVFFLKYFFFRLT